VRRSSAIARPRGAAGWRSPRRLAQGAALALTVVGVFVVRGNAERWCPFGGVETAYAYLTEGNALCSIGVANFFVLGAVLLSLLLLRRAFCSHACPIGTLSEWVRGGARRLGIRGRTVPRTADAALSLLKYGVLAGVLVVTWRIGELWLRGACPVYALLGRHGADITAWAYVSAGAILLGSVFLSLPFCRWLCPFAAVMNPLSRLGLARVGRDAGSCTGCGKCARACPMGIPVDAVASVTHARCTLCLDCVGACRTRGGPALSLRLPGTTGRRITARTAAVVLAGTLLLAVAGAAWFPLPSFRWSRGSPSVAEASVSLSVGDLTCRGRANLFVYFLDRDDDLAVAGPLRLEAWPAPGAGDARIFYDPSVTSPDAIRAALAEPVVDAEVGIFRMSPFRVSGYDPLGLRAPGR